MFSRSSSHAKCPNQLQSPLREDQELCEDGDHHLHLVRRVMRSGVYHSPYAGQIALSIFGHKLEFSLLDGALPHLINGDGSGVSWNQAFKLAVELIVPGCEFARTIDALHWQLARDPQKLQNVVRITDDPGVCSAQFSIIEPDNLVCVVFLSSIDILNRLPECIARYTALTYLVAHHCFLKQKNLIFMLGNGFVVDGDVTVALNRSAYNQPVTLKRVRFLHHYDSISQYNDSDWNIGDFADRAQARSTSTFVDGATAGSEVK